MIIINTNINPFMFRNTEYKREAERRSGYAKRT